MSSKILTLILTIALCFSAMPHTVVIADGNINWAIEPIYDQASDYSNGMARVTKGTFRYREIGFIDINGQEIIPCVYGDAGYFSEGLVAASKGGYRDSLGNYIGGAWGFIDKTGKEVIPFMYQDAWAFREGLAIVKKGDKWGFIDRTGEVVIPIIYDSITAFSDDLAAAQKNGKWGYIDKSGKEIIPFVYNVTNSFHEGLAMVITDGKRSFIDKTGTEAFPCTYTFLGAFSEGLASVDKDGKSGFVDKTGKEVIPLIYDDAMGFHEGLAAVKKDDHWGYINKVGEEIIPLIYDDTGFFSSEGVVRVSKDGKSGYMDKTGKEIVPLKYYYAADFSEGLAAVNNNNFINRAGKEVLPPGILRYYSRFSDGLCVVVKDNKCGYIRNIYTRINVKLNDLYIYFDQPPIIENDRTLIPLRAIFEALGATVNWDEATQTVTAIKGNTTITLQIGSSDINVNGAVATLDVPAQIINDRTMVPTRAVAEALGATVNWDDSTQTVEITQ